MGRVLLLTTGQLERRALPGSLGRLFPAHEFEATEQPLNSFTSVRLAGIDVAGVAYSNVRRLAAAMVAAVMPGSRRKGHYDLVCAVDDLEIVNADQPSLVTRVFREAVSRHVQEHAWASERSREKATLVLRARCSFHLFAPMTEAYFFGEPSAVVRAGAKRRPVLAPGRDLEDFLTIDPAYLEDATTESSDRHPKQYLDWLCRPETYGPREGLAALERLDWRLVTNVLGHVRFARSLLLDVAEALGEPPPVVGEAHPLTSRPARESVLRNL